MINKIENSNRRLVAYLSIACFFTNISQLPALVENGITRVLSLPIWILMTIICIIRYEGKIYLGRTWKVWIFGILFLIYYYFVAFFIPNYRLTQLPYPIAISLFILFVGITIGREIRVQDLSHIFDAYIWSGLIVCISVFFTYIYGNSLEGPQYLYASKNSVSQILLTVWILILMTKFSSRDVLRKLIYATALAFVSLTLIGLKSRATIIVIPVICIIALFNSNVNKKTRWAIIILVGIVALVLMQDGVFDKFVKNVLFAGREAGDIEALSSGRTNEWKTFWSDISGYEIFGQGRRKRESIILTSFLEFGFLGGSLIMFFALAPLKWGITYGKRNGNVQLIFILIAIAYSINGIFEQLAPFGPGVKCYFLWLLFGILVINEGKDSGGHRC